MSANIVAKNDLSNVDKHTIYDKIQDLLDFAKVDLSNVNDSDILNKLKNVDGEGSGLDADLIRGLPADFACDLASNGYQKLPSGLIIQWGVAATTSDDLVTVIFPITYPNKCFFVVVGGHQENKENAGSVMTWNYTTSGFVLDRSNDNYTGEWNFYWMSIGY